MVWFFVLAALVAFVVSALDLASGRLGDGFAALIFGLSLTFAVLCELQVRRYERLIDTAKGVDYRRHRR